MLLVLAVLHLKEKWRFRKKAGSIGRDLTEDSIVLTLMDWASRSFRPWERKPWLHSSGLNNHSIAEKGPVLEMHQDLRDKKDSMLELLLDNEDGRSTPKRNWNALADEDFLIPIAYIPGDYSNEPPVVDILATPNGSVRHIYRSSRSPSTSSAGSRPYAGYEPEVVPPVRYEESYRPGSRSPPRRYYHRSPSSEFRWRNRAVFVPVIRGERRSREPIVAYADGTLSSINCNVYQANKP